MKQGENQFLPPIQFEVVQFEAILLPNLQLPHQVVPMMLYKEKCEIP